MLYIIKTKTNKSKNNSIKHNSIHDLSLKTAEIKKRKNIPVSLLNLHSEFQCLFKKYDPSYVKNPKKNGYRSVHLIIGVPINTLDGVNYVPVEIQVRSIAMDMWASLEHKMCYKKDSLPSEFKDSVVMMANTSSYIDDIMNIMIYECNNNDKYYTPKIRDKEGLMNIVDCSKMKYKLARKYLEDKIECLNMFYKESLDVNPIEHIKSRIKSSESICQKLEKNNYLVNVTNMENHIHDIVGIRVVCSFLSDIEKIKSYIEFMSDNGQIFIRKINDYISNPKDNGYRSYHMNVLVPINVFNEVEYVEAEIQIRTIAMDMWASLEEKLCYKKEGEEPKEIIDNLRKISSLVSSVDDNLDDLVNKYSKIEEVNCKKRIRAKN